MPFFKKKRDELPEPEGEGFPELEQLKESLAKIKSEIEAKESAIQNTITSSASPAVPPALPVLPELPELPETPTPTPDSGPELPELPELPEEIEEPEEPELEKPAKPKLTAKGKTNAAKAKAERPLFIKVDRFKEILASTRVIGDKIEAIEGIIQKLKDIREKESETMKQWESEIEELKSKLEAIESALKEVQ